jgi:poly(3-hydroxybutyrate) depolymerase
MLSLPLGLSIFASVGAAAPHTLLYERAGSGCNTSPPWSAGSFNDSTIEIGDSHRKYGVWIPENYDQTKETSLIFSYHGAGKDITNQKDLDSFTDPDFNTDHIVVYLQGVSYFSTLRHEFTTNIA